MLFKATLEPIERGPMRAAAMVAESKEEATEKLRQAWPAYRVLYVTQVEERPQEVLQIDETGYADCEKKPVRLWTVIPWADGEITLPFVPVHNINAFLEDETHDWSWRNGRLRYYSRIADPPVRVIAEY